MEGVHLLWVKYLGIPSVIVWGKYNVFYLFLIFNKVLIVPFIIGASLYKYKDVIERPDIANTFGFITKGYRSEYFFWEIVIMYRKSLLVIGSVFIKIDPFLNVKYMQNINI